ncbi:cytidine deaminase [Clostridium pasteurianum DSM 525 = ATCC 6013]|uniref:Cytidine deaminase n=1 Tax=Clostridium pasteurianum DSM 525 = ATCC 6013 TaxID=1262449 RepID=A0A0H3J8R7_CLOPA|nr:cytidine deaminase [Clostridium pasteurianum]AJA48368.1 cytidine deaminase [Clostridium pasteurianum DSM 525 = ATCC 6013]AJA52356.1 cytidine deaminase [Clostridium pasteurianum DSM 525 = ATCC 6013]AOZ75614.1 cytidine deaminase [Clostridium pasteurianum DSM 525 = ATCC 6013]AOZ79410.1 cytidine deaminase [Clostridium pasteurianum]ELP60482.1 cytidine deaminase [Clostridium pasteurianum DSM 525 = ATCC 6013]
MNYKKLILKAMEAREKAYAPYSKFKVGAAVIMDDDKLYSGCNIENASYGATNCAERTAIFKAVSEESKIIKAIAIVGDTVNYTYPCGICRQVIEEFSDGNTNIILAKNENDYIIKSFSQLFPGAFSKKDLI